MSDISFDYVPKDKKYDGTVKVKLLPNYERLDNIKQCGISFDAKGEMKFENNDQVGSMAKVMRCLRQLILDCCVTNKETNETYKTVDELFVYGDELLNEMTFFVFSPKSLGNEKRKKSSG